MKLLVTAFGPFGGRARNASSLALAGLKQRQPWLNTRILPVDSRIAPLRLTQALRQVEPDAVILLGEAGNSRAIRLETLGWNELDFRIPDIAGRQPQNGHIVNGGPASLSSTLPIALMMEALLGADHPAELSSDPGRYLCNQVLYHTLHTVRGAIPAGFIHLPLECDYPTPLAVDAVELMVSIVRKENTAAPWAARRAARSGVRGHWR